MHHAGIHPRHCQGIYFPLFHDIYNMAYSGGSQNNGDPFHKLLFIWDYQGYLVFIIALDSIHLNLDNNIA